MNYYTDDPVRDAERWIEAQERRLELLPKCCCCCEPIQAEEAICVNDEWYCSECELDAWDAVRASFLRAVDFE